MYDRIDNDMGAPNRIVGRGNRNELNLYFNTEQRIPKP